MPGVRVPSPALGLRERLLEVGPDLLDRLEADREAQQTGRDAVTLPAIAALHGRAGSTQARRVQDHARRRLDGLRVGDIERDQAAEARVAHVLDGRMLAQAP